MEEHDNRESAWFMYENKVYDGTKFLNDHPGGPESILIVAGQVSCCICSKPADAFLHAYICRPKHKGRVGTTYLRNNMSW